MCVKSLASGGVPVKLVTVIPSISIVSWPLAPVPWKFSSPIVTSSLWVLTELVSSVQGLLSVENARVSPIKTPFRLSDTADGFWLYGTGSLTNIVPSTFISLFVVVYYLSDFSY